MISFGHELECPASVSDRFRNIAECLSNKSAANIKCRRKRFKLCFVYNDHLA